MNPYDAPRNDYDRFVAGIRPDDGEITSMLKWQAHRQRHEEQSAPPKRPARRRPVVISDGRPATLGDALAGIVMIGAIVYGGYWLITRGDANKRPLYQVRTETQAEMAQRCGAFVRALPSPDDKAMRDTRDSCLSLGPLRKAVADR